MTDNVTPLKPKAKPGPKPRPAALNDVAKVDLGLEGIGFDGSANPGQATNYYLGTAETWNGYNEQRDAEGHLGLDGLLVEYAFRAAGTADRGVLLKLAHIALVAADEVVE